MKVKKGTDGLTPYIANLMIYYVNDLINDIN